MAKKKTVLKVNNSSRKSQQEILSAVAKITGVDKLEMDANKGTLTVVGEVEPIPIFKALEKIGKCPEIVSVGPPKPKKRDQYSNYDSCGPYYDQQKRSYPPCCSNSSCCQKCDLVSVGYPMSSDPGSGHCSIL